MKNWIAATRLRTLPLALSCTFMGSAYALKEGSFNWLIFLLAILTTTLLQILSNFANDYGDFKNGADTVAGRSDRMLSSGQITAGQMKQALRLFSILSFVSGSCLLYCSFNWSQITELLIMLFLGLTAIWAALKYTAGDNPYGYRGFGDFFVFLFFGLVGVIGTQYLYTEELGLYHISYAFIIGFLSVAVLNLNNMRDVISDEEAGKITLVVRLGFKNAKIYHTSLLVFAWLLIIYELVNDFNLYLLLTVIPVVVQIKHLVFVLSCVDPKKLDQELKKVALTTFLIALIFFTSAMMAV